MSVMEIKTAGAPVLKQVCEPVRRVDSKIKKLLDQMKDTLYKANGVGLAAPQVGVPIRVVVIDAGTGYYELINPEIVERSGTELDTEGCLSVPGIWGEVERSAKVTVEFTNRRGKRQRIKDATGLLARCIQHELDHLEGVLFIDIAKSLREERAE